MVFDVVYSVTSLLYTFLVALIITIIVLKWYRERNYPPGPIGIPLIGYVLFLLRKKPHETLGELSRKYGDVFSFKIGPYLNICVNDYNMAKELLCNPKLLYRPEIFARVMPARGGLAGMNGEEWQEQRRFTFHTLRNLGLGKGLWETMIQEAVVEFTEELKSLKGQPKNLDDVLNVFHASNIVSLLLGRHLDKEKDAEEIHIIDKYTKKSTNHLAIVSIFVLFPWTRKILEVFSIGGYDEFLSNVNKFEGIFKKEVDERMKSSESLVRDDYIGCFLKEMKNREKETKKHTFTVESLMGNLLLLFLSSNETTKSAISWLLLYMIAYPGIQKRVHDEIDSVVGRDGAICFDDKAKFPYTMATIFEMLRHASISPIPPRIIPEDMTIDNYTVPKGSFLAVNTWAIMHDARYFKEPMEFKPERFFNEDNKIVKNIDGFIPFSVGKRNCPGEGIAIMTIFLYFVSFMQKFKVTMPAEKKVDLEPIFGTGGNVPKPHEICFLER